MIKNIYLMLGRAKAFQLSALFLLCGASTSMAAPDAISVEIDKSATAAKPASAAVAQIEKLSSTPLICLNLKVTLDGKVPDALRRSAEEDNPNVISRDLVPCGPAMTGQLTMGPGIEYYLVTEGAAGNRVDLSVYPGSRTEHIVNDVACVFDDAGVVFRARGLFRPVTNRYQEVDKDGKATGKAILSIQLRPVTPSRQEVSECSP